MAESVMAKDGIIPAWLIGVTLGSALSQCISGQSAKRKRQLTVHPKIVSDM